ncbi:MAG: phosphoglycerate kinase [Candidatus Magasanikbacteria bacterium]
MKLLRTQKNLEGKRVLVRVDFNVPVEKGKITDNTRILSSLPTIEYLKEKKAKILLVTHFGRPEGKAVSSLKVDTIIKEVEYLMQIKIKKIETKNWKLNKKEKEQIQRQIEGMRNGSIAMLENIRFAKDEQENTGTLSQDLATLADLFVLDGFGVAHRNDASVSGITQYVRSCAGFLLENEVKALNKILTHPKKPMCIILGGAKVETKVPVIDKLVKNADSILIGGVIFNTYLKSLGYGVGDSLVEEKYLRNTKISCQKRKVVKPIDVIVGDKKGKNYHVVMLDESKKEICKKGEMILDIGPMSVCLFSKYIKKAETLVWNGAMGYFEQTPYDMGTREVAQLMAERSKGKAYGVIGGGETIEAMELVGLDHYIDFISTGGGAMLQYLAGDILPGIEALK